MSDTHDRVAALLASSEAGEKQEGIVLVARGKHVEFIDELVTIAGSDNDERTRYLARKAVEKLKETESQGVNLSAEFSDVKCDKLLISKNPKVRFEGLKKALLEKTDESHKALLEAIGREKLPQLLSSMLIALGHFKDSADVSLLAGYLRHADSRIRANSVDGLAFIGTEEALRAIISMMPDEDNRVRGNVLKALQQLGGNALFSMLKRMSQDERPWMRESAIYAFSRIKSPQSLMALGNVAQNDAELRLRKTAIEALKNEQSGGSTVAAEILDKIFRREVSLDGAKGVGRGLDNADEIRRALQSEDIARRYLALNRLNEVYSPDLATAFNEAFELETDQFLLSMMLTCIKNNEISCSQWRIESLLSHQDDRIRANAVEAIDFANIERFADKLKHLLSDRNSRVVANSLIALNSIEMVDLFTEIEAMVNRVRESFKLSALYVISQYPEPELIKILERLLNDHNPAVRDRAYFVLKLYFNDNVSGAALMLKEVERQRKLEKNRHQFFDNMMDQLFGSFLQMIAAIDDDSNSGRNLKNPEAEHKALLKLAHKALAASILDDRTILTLKGIEKDLGDLEKIIAAQAEVESMDTEVAETASRATETQLIAIELNSLKARKDAILVASAFDLFSRKDKLGPETLALLSEELEQVEKNQITHVPYGGFTMLPPFNSPVSEIFDVAMRIYQKHVWIFSYESIMQFISLAAFAFAFRVVIEMHRNGDLPMLFLVIVSPFFIYKLISIITTWKLRVSLMVAHYIKGRESSYLDIMRLANSMHASAMVYVLQKNFYLLLWFIIAAIPSVVLSTASEVFGSALYLQSFGKLVAAVLFFAVFSMVFIKYEFIEPVLALKNDADPFENADKIFHHKRTTAITLYIFAFFIVMMVSSFSVLLAGILIPLLPAVWLRRPLEVIVVIMSQVCLLPIIYSALVIYSMSYFRQLRLFGRV